MSKPGEQKGGEARCLPKLEFYDHLDGAAALGDQWDTLADRARQALSLCLQSPAPTESASPAVLADLSVVEISVVSDDAIAAVHADFMNDPSPTDVITFHHGEILISAETARARAQELRQPVLRELLLYVIHGLLHLNGHEDGEVHARRRMHETQDGILAAVWPLPGD